VKKIIGGAEGWKVEGFALEKEAEVPRDSIPGVDGLVSPIQDHPSACFPLSRRKILDSRRCNGSS